MTPLAKSRSLLTHAPKDHSSPRAPHGVRRSRGLRDDSEGGGARTETGTAAAAAPAKDKSSSSSKERNQHGTAVTQQDSEEVVSAMAVDKQKLDNTVKDTKHRLQIPNHNISNLEDLQNNYNFNTNINNNNTGAVKPHSTPETTSEHGPRTPPPELSVFSHITAFISKDRKQNLQPTCSSTTKTHSLQKITAQFQDYNRGQHNFFHIFTLYFGLHPFSILADMLCLPLHAKYSHYSTVLSKNCACMCGWVEASKSTLPDLFY
uniref:uncharacterized protein LOC124055552 n=1 Tax=Scatophagus argus TaxID=75038 RepID=UPI001ED82814|nr:uncharacterized protein LOC124055552 [Scatophagus argus]